ncbi:Uncharacterised protein [Chromobacterium violaceum]|uniref:Uncharacterized protein n=1 Tax=Chromobacterium violaceum TaxID=536 RepID=A0A3S4JVF3_CHRVL|nr:Uncharacterised protein [Chromobacterium violaceum]
MSIPKLNAYPLPQAADFPPTRPPGAWIPSAPRC